MHVTLPESTKVRKRQSSGLLASVVAHAAVLAALLAKSGWTAVSDAEPRPASLRYTELRPADPQPRHPPAASMGATAMDAPPTIPALDLPAVIMTAIPDLAASATVLDPPTFDGRPFGQNTAGRNPGALGDTGVAVFDWRTVDRPAEARAGNPIPRYPSALSSAGVEGSVAVRFVVDTLGTVERGSARTLRASHPLFEQAVREALARMRFQSAEAGGKKVRQMVEQSFHFEIRR